jgi:hypothetical protein
MTVVEWPNRERELAEELVEREQDIAERLRTNPWTCDILHEFAGYMSAIWQEKTNNRQHEEAAGIADATQRLIEIGNRVEGERDA